MKLLIALYFYILATIQLGLLLGVYHYYRSQSVVKPSPYWLGSLIVSILALITFGTGILIIQDVAKPEFNFTIANSLFYLAAILQFLFCKSLVGQTSNRFKYYLLSSVIIFAPTFEWLRINGTFEIRTAVMCVVTGFFFIWQIFLLRSKRKATPSNQLMYLQYATAAELFFVFGRLFIVMTSGSTIRQIEELPQILILLTITQIVMNTLSYIALSGYWTEKISLVNAKSEIENKEIKALLLEREGLISSLLRVNKTAATGALSASIAHELNQPLGASYLNIQFLQKKLADGNLSAEQNQEVLTALLSDNQRAANIIRSLRSIFSDGKIGAEELGVSELIESVLKITKPEIQSKNIQVVLGLKSQRLINASRGEMQQVILNLVNNAIQAFDTENRLPAVLTIESRDVGDGVELIFSDNGPGIAPNNQAQLFELFAGSHKEAGMGLGLWLCQHIVSRHGGRIRYEDAPGGGARFIIFLPVMR